MHEYDVIFLKGYVWFIPSGNGGDVNRNGLALAILIHP